MLTTVLVICAVLGGTILVCQTALTLLGLAGDSLHLDVSADVGHGGGDLHADGADLGGAGGHLDHAGNVGHDAQAGHSQAAHASSWLFAMISFRTMVAAIAFFGLAGLAAQAAGASPAFVLVIGAAAGAGAMYGVYWIMQLLYQARSEGTVRVQRAVGQPATVYLRIPGQRAGQGKVLLDLQDRTMEYDAMTSGPALPTGAAVVVTGLVSANTLEVRSVPESERNSS